MSEMVDRVARAISFSFHEEGFIEGQSDPSEWEEFLKAARLAIEAMREPTEAMAMAPYNLEGVVLDEQFAIPSESTEIWQAMIDAALGVGALDTVSPK